MSFKNEDSTGGSHIRGIRVLTATLLTTGSFGAMAMFGGMSYAIASVHHAVGGQHKHSCGQRVLRYLVRS